MDRTAINDAIQKLTDERARLEGECKRIDQAIDALRPLVGTEPHTNGNGNGNGVAQNGQVVVAKGKMRDVVKLLSKAGEPLTAKSTHLALGRRAPSNVTTTNAIMCKAVARGLIVRSGVKGSYRYSVA
jgi:hypothetical protein